MAEPQRVATITVDLGVPHHLDDDCPSCGWADLWRCALVRLTTAGVSTLGEVTRCQRCGHKVASKSRG